MISSVRIKETSPPLEICRLLFIRRNKYHPAYCEKRKRRRYDKVKELGIMYFVGNEQVYERKFSKLLPAFSIIQNICQTPYRW